MKKIHTFESFTNSVSEGKLNMKKMIKAAGKALSKGADNDDLDMFIDDYLEDNGIPFDEFDYDEREELYQGLDNDYGIYIEEKSHVSENKPVNENTRKLKKEIQNHLDQFYGGNIDGNDLANAIEEILSDMMKRSVSFSDIREGTWSVGTKEQIGNFIKDVEKIKIHYNDIVGDDEVYNGLDSAVFRAEEMMEMVAENKSDLREAEYTDRVGKSRLASNKYKQADEFNKSYDSVAQAAAEKQFDDDVIDKAASKRAKKEPIGKEAERLAQVQKFMRQMQDKGIVDKDKKILDTPKYKEEFAKFKADLKKKKLEESF